jgi:SSS family transporter
MMPVASVGLLHRLDILIVVAYIFITCVIALKMRFQKSGDDYYLAGRNTHWFFIAISTFATLFSTLSFVMVPAEVWDHGLQLSLLWIFGIPMLPVAAHVMLKFFFKRPIFTSYEYLEKRYNVFCRVVGASFFVLARFIYMAIVLYSTGVIFNSVFNFPIITVILVVGIITMSYTLIGGMRAVIFTDFFQSIMLIVGIVAVVYFIGKGFGFHWIDEFGKLATTDKRFSYEFLCQADFYKIKYQDRFNILIVLFAFLHGPFSSVSSDQLVVQRLLGTKGFKEACKAIYGNMLLSFPVSCLVWGIGVGLVLFYKHNNLPEDIKANDVLGYFIRTRLPSPIPGLVCAAMLAMMMSTISGVINSLSTVVHRDIFSKLPWNSISSLTVKNARLMTLCLGILGVILSVAVAMLGESSSIGLFEFAGAIIGGWSILTVAFVLGVLCPWVKPWAVSVGMCCGGLGMWITQWVLYFSQPSASRIGFVYIDIIAAGITLLVTVFLSLCDRRPYKAPEDTTLFSLLREEKKSMRECELLAEAKTI